MGINGSIGARLKQERRRFKLTQQEVAEHAKITRKTQRVYEMDTRSPSAEYLQQVSKLGIDVLYVVTGRREPLSDDD